MIKKLFIKLFKKEIEKINKKFQEETLIIAEQICDYKLSMAQNDNAEEKKAFAYDELKNRYKETGIPVEEITLDIDTFESWMEDFKEIADFYRRKDDVFIQKCMEHYLSCTLLNLSPGTVHIDIAAASSIFSDILIKRGIDSYKLDLSYPQGVKGKKIGANAGNTGLSNEFADSLTLHCAFECFMGNSDTEFIKEAERILKKNGKALIIPLYTANEFINLSSPYCNQNKVKIDKNAKRVWREDKYKEPFSRNYSPEAFYERVYSQMPLSLNGKILILSNLSELQNKYPGQRIYTYFMFYCEKV